MHRRCINEYIAFADKRVKTASATDRAERPLPLPRGFKDGRGFAAFLRRTAAPLAARIAAVPDDDDELFCDVARDAQSEFERAVRDQCAGMQRHDLNRLLAALGVVESWADAPATPPEPPKPVATTATKPSRAGAKPVAPVPAPDLKSESGSRIAYRRASEIQAKPVNWLWHGRIARGKVSMLAGNPGLGKSQITASMAATVTTGGTWPVDRARCERGNVVFLSAEDDAEDTIRPRLEAAGADLARVYILDAVVDGYTPQTLHPG